MNVLRVTGLPVILLIALTAVIAPSSGRAEPWAPPGDLVLRDDLQRLNDAGAIDLPLTTWPLSWGDIERAIGGVRPDELPISVAGAYERIEDRLQAATSYDGPRYGVSASAAGEPRIIRSFEDTPREDGQVSPGISWMGTRFSFNLTASYVVDPDDGDNFRPDGSYVGLTLGNWLLSAGWQERWWGPGRDGSLILSSNARPPPGIAIQRNRSTAFETPWLSWIGPWSLTAFMSRLDDERVIEDTLLFGMRVAFKPLDSLEIGLSRTAQWCGEGRPCDFGAFTDLLLGNDNRGVNVDPGQEPGNQLAGFDLRWSLPWKVPAALYLQWIGEDTRQGGPQIGSWLRQAGIEYWGSVHGNDFRAHLEAADTTCREGVVGFADAKPDCAYEHSIYRTGYRYKGRVLGHSMDGDGLSYSLGTTLVQPDGDSWNLTVRHMELNRLGVASTTHTLSATPRDLTDVQLTREHLTRLGRFTLGLGASRFDDPGADSDTDLSGFVEWVME